MVLNHPCLESIEQVFDETHLWPVRAAVLRADRNVIPLIVHGTCHGVEPDSERTGYDKPSEGVFGLGMHPFWVDSELV